MICPKCGGDTFIMVPDIGLKCEKCGYIYSITKKKRIFKKVGYEGRLTVSSRNDTCEHMMGNLSLFCLPK